LSKSYSKISDFKEQLINDIRDSMENGVSKSVEVKMHHAIQEKVYDEYLHPKRYVRRTYGEGGLLNSKSFWHESKRDGNKVRFTAENRAKANLDYERIEGSASQYLTPLIVYGHGGAGGKYSWGDEYPYSYIKPRNFIEETRRMLRVEKNHVTGLWLSLEDKGYETSTF
jgi:hypothetical protein